MTRKLKRSGLLKAFLEHKNVLAAYIAQRVVRSEDVEDILQEAFIELELADRRDSVRSPKSYLFIVARNIVSKQLARQAKRRTLQLDEVNGNTCAPRSDNPDQQLHFKLKLKAFSAAVDSLPPQCRKVFLLRKVRGLSHRKIVAELGISQSTVERHITLAMSRLSSEMLKQGYSEPRKAIVVAEIKASRRRPAK